MPSAEEKSIHSNHSISTDHSGTSTPVKETREDEVKNAETAESSPKTLRELSEEVKQISNYINEDKAESSHDDEGIDMKGIGNYCIF